MSRPNSAAPGWRRSLRSLLLVIAAGAVIAPVVVYLFGVTVFAPYEGQGGLPGFLGSVYGSALAGSSAAWVLLLSPAALWLTWWGIYRLLGAARPAARKNS
jgi:hypothetical protein